MTTVQLRLISAYTTLVMAGRKTIDEVREDLQEAVRIRIAEIEIEKLSEV